MIEILENSLFRASELDKLGAGIIKVPAGPNASLSYWLLRSINPAGITTWPSEVHVEKVDSWILKELGDDFFGSVALNDVSTDQHIYRVKRPDR
jgi:hypothetical protein